MPAPVAKYPSLVRHSEQAWEGVAEIHRGRVPNPGHMLLHRVAFGGECFT